MAVEALMNCGSKCACQRLQGLEECHALTGLLAPSAAMACADERVLVCIQKPAAAQHIMDTRRLKSLRP